MPQFSASLVVPKLCDVTSWRAVTPWRGTVAWPAVTPWRGMTPWSFVTPWSVVTSWSGVTPWRAVTPWSAVTPWAWHDTVECRGLQWCHEIFNCFHWNINLLGPSMVMYCPGRFNYDMKCTFFLKRKKLEYAKKKKKTPIKLGFKQNKSSVLVWYLWKIKCVEYLHTWKQYAHCDFGQEAFRFHTEITA